MKKRLSLLIAAVGIVSCVAGAGMSSLVVPGVRAGTSPQKWEYHCINLAHNQSENTTEANSLGSEGWEMSGYAAGGDNKPKACFKRPLP